MKLEFTDMAKADLAFWEAIRRLALDKYWASSKQSMSGPFHVSFQVRTVEEVPHWSNP
jgi:hypothetical protein